MKREILFKGKRLDNNEWVYGYIYERDGHYYIVTLETEVEVIPETVSQFTGLSDKNGVEIFENDIVRWDDETNGEKWRVAVVEYNPDIQFKIIRIECDFIQSAKEGYVFKFGNFAYKDTYNHLEIIGNIHE